MRRLQSVYWLEPAGSHGVWGLDDYHFLPFMFGSAQLCGKWQSIYIYIGYLADTDPKRVNRPQVSATTVYPRQGHSRRILPRLHVLCVHPLYQFGGSITARHPFIYLSLYIQVKTESLRWHSPMLDDISGVKTWEKVNQGMGKMYRAEVLGKLPIMQHFMFGQLLHFDGGSADAESEAMCGEHRHVHALGQERPLCCGMRIPSAFGASTEQQQTRHRLPFD